MPIANERIWQVSEQTIYTKYRTCDDLVAIVTFNGSKVVSLFEDQWIVVVFQHVANRRGAYHCQTNARLKEILQQKRMGFLAASGQCWIVELLKDWSKSKVKKDMQLALSKRLGRALFFAAWQAFFATWQGSGCVSSHLV